jgi:hypothetical protein
MRRVVVLLGLLTLLPCLMGASNAILGAVANPGGTPGRIDENGTYLIGAGDFFMRVEGRAQETTTMIDSGSNAAINSATLTWTHSLTGLPAGTYGCYGRTVYHRGNPAMPRNADSAPLVRTIN